MSKESEALAILKDVDKSLAELIDMAKKRQEALEEYIKQLEETKR